MEHTIVRSATISNLAANNTPSGQLLTEYEELTQVMSQRLRQVMKALLDQRKQYERQMAQTMQEMQEQYERKLEEKGKLVAELSRTVDMLISNSKQMELDYSRKLAEHEQEIQTYKNMLKKKYLKEIDLERQFRKEGVQINFQRIGSPTKDSPQPLTRVLSQQVSQLSQNSKTSWLETHKSCPSNHKSNESEAVADREHDLQTRASTLANKTSQLLSALKMRSDIGKKSAFVKKVNPRDNSIVSASSTYIPSKQPMSRYESQLIQL